MATDKKPTKPVSDSGVKNLHQTLRDSRKKHLDIKLELKLGRLKDTSSVKKHRKEIARSLTKLNASRIIASLKNQ